jgi:hypothetical protein
MTRRGRIVILTCALLVLAAGVAWYFVIGPARMIAAIQHEDVSRIGLFSHLGIRPDSDAFLVGGFMHCATASGLTRSMAKLHDLGASVNRVDGYGLAPLHVAVRSQRIESLRWLLAHGADPAIRDRDGRTAADYVSTDVPQQQREEFISELKRASNHPAGGNAGLGMSFAFSRQWSGVPQSGRWAA